MNTRDKYIAEGIIRPRTYHLRSHGRELEDKTVRQTLIEQGKVRPCDNEHKSFDLDALTERVNLRPVMREFLWRWYSKSSRRWEGPRNRDGVWS